MSSTIKVRSIVYECPDPSALAEFYSTITGWEVAYADDEWVTVKEGDVVRLCFQKAPGFQPPTWPDPASPMQMHVDFTVDDLDETEKVVIAAGARKFDFQPGDDFRVFADPVGHPFCLCL